MGSWDVMQTRSDALQGENGRWDRFSTDHRMQVANLRHRGTPCQLRTSDGFFLCGPLANDHRALRS